MTNTYWDHNGKHQELAVQLQEMVPTEGTVDRPFKNKALEKFRKAQNCYYDLYNNGLFNRAKQFYGIFGVSSAPYRTPSRGFLPRLYSLVEEKMDEIIINAAKEQGLLS